MKQHSLQEFGGSGWCHCFEFLSVVWYC